MMAAQLKETTMDPKKRTLLRVDVIDGDENGDEVAVDALMGTKPERPLPLHPGARRIRRRPKRWISSR